MALVGGASQGIGYAIAHLLAGEGAQVAMVVRRGQALNDAALRIAQKAGATTLPIAADIRKAADCERITCETLDRFGRVEVLVNNDGTPPLGEIERFGLSVATWAGVLGYSKTLSLEIAKAGITVHFICPGRIQTPRLRPPMALPQNAPVAALSRAGCRVQRRCLSQRAAPGQREPGFALRALQGSLYS